MAGRWFSPGTPVSSTNTTDRHDIAEILLKVVLNTISLNQTLTVNMLRMLDMMVDISNLLNLSYSVSPSKEQQSS